MKEDLRVVFALVCALAMSVGVQAQVQETTPPLVRKIYDGNWPSVEEAQRLRDELFYQRAIHAYMTMLPALNTIGLRDGSDVGFFDQTWRPDDVVKIK